MANSAESNDAPTSETGDSTHVQCNVCDKMVALESYPLHFQQHSDQNPFACPHPNCGKTFAFKAGLRRHEQRHIVDFKCSCGFESNRREVMNSHRCQASQVSPRRAPVEDPSPAPSVPAAPLRDACPAPQRSPVGEILDCFPDDVIIPLSDAPLAPLSNAPSVPSIASCVSQAHLPFQFPMPYFLTPQGFAPLFQLPSCCPLHHTQAPSVQPPAPSVQPQTPPVQQTAPPVQPPAPPIQPLAPSVQPLALPESPLSEETVDVAMKQSPSASAQEPANHVPETTNKLNFPVRCRICSKKIKSFNSFVAHMREHTGERPFACKLSGCERTFAQKTSLYQHELWHKIHADAAV